MKITVILAHPGRESFNHAIAKTTVEKLLENGHEVSFHDLYGEKFNPILPFEEIPGDVSLPLEVEKHCGEIQKAEGIVIIHPNWWGQPPAILKGWVDRVMRPGVAYRFVGEDQGEGVPEGLLKAKAAIVFNTANTPPGRESEVFGDPLQLLWKNCIFDLCGVPAFHRETFTVMVTSTHEERQSWLRKAGEVIGHYFPRRAEGSGGRQ